MFKHGINLIEIIKLLNNRKKFLLTVFVLTSIFGVVISLLLPKYFLSKTTILIPSESGFGGFSSLFGTSINLTRALDLTGDDYKILINSEAILLQVADDFNLSDYYEEDNTDKLLKKIRNDIILNDVVAGGFANRKIISLEVGYYNKIPKKAADVVNQIIFLLQEQIKKMDINTASNKREFLEKRLKDTKNEFLEIMGNFQIFKDTTNIYNLESQIMGIVDMMTEVQGELFKNYYSVYIEYQLNKELLGIKNEKVKNLEKQVKIFENEITNILNNYSIYKTNNGVSLSYYNDYMIPYIEFEIEVEKYKKLLEFLETSYEQAKLQEVNETPQIHIVDKGRVPEKKAKPKRAYIVLAIVFTVMFSTIFFLIFKEYYKKNE